jgi:hypothetical protein
MTQALYAHMNNKRKKRNCELLGKIFKENMLLSKVNMIFIQM